MTTLDSYGARSIRGRPRRTRAEVQIIRGELFEILVQNKPMTVRQVFYQAVSRGLINKTEAEYKGTVGRLLTDMRLEGEIPFDWLSDSTRWMRKPRTYDSLETALQQTSQYYRRDLWSNQDTYLEVWTEKDAIAGVLFDVTAEWDVPLMVTRGYSSLTFLHEAAKTIEALDKPAHLFYFGDWDPSGLDIETQIENRLREFGADLVFERVAVTPDQVSAWNLPTRPTKKTDSRSKRFSGESVEVDAIHPQQLRELVSQCITEHVDPDALKVVRVAEQSERELLKKIVELQKGNRLKDQVR